MTFQSPNLLWALCLLAIPIIIHLFQFKRYKQLLFPDVSLLKEVQSRSQTKNQIRHILVLLSRLFLITFLVLAFARPFIPAENNQAQSSKRVSIYIDNSFSMQNANANGTLLSNATQRAYEIASSYPSGTDFQIITNELEPFQKQFSDFDSFIESLDQVSITPEKADGKRIIDFYKSGLRDNGLSNAVLYLISDFNNILNQEISLDSTTQLRVVPLTGTQTNNVSVDSVWIESPILTKGKQEILFMRITNHGNGLAQDISVDVLINANLSNSLLVTIEPDSYLDTSVTIVLNTSGTLKGKISIKDSPIQYDNNLFFTLPIRANVSVVEISGPESDSNPFKKLFEAQEDILYQSMESNSIILDSAASADFIILNEIEEYNTGLFALLKQKLAEGINIYAVPPRSFNEKEKLKWNNEFGIEIGELDTSRYSISKINLDNKLYKAIFEEQPKNINLPTSGAYYRLKNASIESSLLKFSNEKPFLTDYPRLNGNIYFQSSPQSSPGNSFSRHALFVPTLYNAALLSGSGMKINYKVSDVKVLLPQVKLNESIEIRGSDSASFIPAITYDGLYVSDQIRKEGFYDLYSEEVKVESYAFNYDRSESSLKSPSIEEISAYFKSQNIEIEIIEVNGDQLKSKINTADLGYELWYWAVFIALIFVLIESVLIKIFNG